VLLVLAVSNQLFFLTAVLPEVLPGLGVAPDRVVEVGGLLVFISAVAAGLGALATPRLAARVPEGTLVAVLLVLSGLLMARMALPRSAWGYSVVRFLQVLFARADLPARRRANRAAGERRRHRRHQLGADRRLVHRTRARHYDPLRISPAVLYVTLGVGCLACVPLALGRWTRSTGRRTP
jgi:hypothetical protein